MVEQIVREYVNGEWVTRAVASGGGGTGVPTGWTQSGNPAGLDAHGGTLVDLDTLGVRSTGSIGLATSGDTIRIVANTSDPSSGGYIAPVGSLYLRTNGELWVKTGAGNTDWTQVGGVPEGTVKRVRLPIAYNDAGIIVTMLDITAATDGPGSTITVAGDHAAAFPAGSCARIFNSNSNDGAYTVASAVFGVATVITLVEPLVDNNVSGGVYDNTSGVIVYTPDADNETLMGGWVSLPVATPWNGSSPTLRLLVEGDDPGGALTPLIDLTALDVQQFVTGAVQNNFVLVSGYQLVLQSTKPFRAVIDDTSYADPGATQGAGEIVLVIATA